VRAAKTAVFFAGSTFCGIYGAAESRALSKRRLLLTIEDDMDYLLKTEPSTYSFADLQREKTTIWDGVSNPVALKNLRGMKAGERLIIYHTGDEKSAVGTASVVSVDASDAKNPQVKIKVGKANAKPVTLAEAKANPLFAESPLARQGRLSVVPLNEAQFKFLMGE
jgi:predicted RNA-binding protein with PUA-like domain